ncbi:MAG: (2Fe-2S)-binding protein [Chlorobium sp.]|jgi:chlorosome envelope protein J|uniref:2Fe-2S iron-sulfur cluster-binding protein n=1 Tax=Chlorobium sp. TaxID=1095 RepID=UPI0025C4E001|nr:2Fe-2S iron-sulfur cluster-binding protein [Chlorobium sp.]MCF8217217.1 (2Fe-2S)-binding protein [Chlorobium sp.]MCF8272075.1 (2Fe-2S)-binding protein [Chlorobium sp.]MCF8288436.1 (2Fe-2S)-binding protein [Chlorobium sp.]MCF8292026.1 (2Fe-2S)-binding protein [Chlorobium sp.]MCF8386139.1 (2Fe-2S)-binding protein [Chlorobium sp.]
MIIYINDKPCKAETGDLLLHAAQLHNAHIGCICGGNGICQSCFVYIREGAELLSPPSDEEKAFISDKLFQEGGRLACQTVITGEGTIRLLTRAENLRRIVLGLNIPGFITYAQTIGYNVTRKLPEGAMNVVSRIKEGKLNPAESIGKIGNSIAYGANFALHTAMETLPVIQAPLAFVTDAMQKPASFISGTLQSPISLISGAANGIFNATSSMLCNASGGRLSLPGTSCSPGDVQKPKQVENVTITIK